MDAWRQASKRVSPLLILSYALDWILLAVGAAVGYVLGELKPNKRPFALDDRSIRYPYSDGSTVPGYALVICGALAPILVILLLSLTLTPAGLPHHGSQKSRVWKHKLWELHVSWMGLALSLISTWIITNGLKNMLGKPRPDLLSRCRPDLSRVEEFIVGETGLSTDGMLVSAGICTNADVGLLDDGFRAYPSGHASLSAGGLIYLTLFLLSRFGIVTPFLIFGHSGDHQTPSQTSQTTQPAAPLDRNHDLPAPQPSTDIPPTPSLSGSHSSPSAQPLYLLLIALVPFFTAIFIGGSRWFDYRHHGIDILSGLLIGAATAIFSFFYFHAPISSGRGRAWAPRKGKGFWGVGKDEYRSGSLRNCWRSYASDRR
ncbi:PAP2 superfamily-domain-containing protein [Immersiella caudata]|uniref:PAP2 superfamily-domain-containing protein n=1 Tax=Immersiella caudata TaxID=314043 RepID=A0AA40BX20_9PEZI|nr:PAP2 superfamily-domain-containing protein [Immersiella caudata]